MAAAKGTTFISPVFVHNYLWFGVSQVGWPSGQWPLKGNLLSESNLHFFTTATTTTLESYLPGPMLVIKVYEHKNSENAGFSEVIFPQIPFASLQWPAPRLLDDA